MSSAVDAGVGPAHALDGEFAEGDAVTLEFGGDGIALDVFAAKVDNDGAGDVRVGTQRDERSSRAVVVVSEEILGASLSWE